ncbi:hypothetical protein INN71_09770 [Nocardioides sp. ChNu-153]|uniref:hypothetical protein n=1 Tax=unclassified Nocardioides TaxID=2615069 RepID=UPI002404CA7A|nr:MULTISPECIES: hypothetical protein [unclassified Nocardioides]MDF9715694.1 hypothetical protein [Nocardioides sp. ChNu-99]MDN7121677.1 hypothetical protein [Nocardioides sp. ChNu-153]
MSRLNVRRAVAATSLSVLAVSGLAACGSDDSDNADNGTDSSQSGDSGDSDDSGDSGDAVDDSRFGVAEGEEVAVEEFAAAYGDAIDQMDTAAVTMETTTGSTTSSLEGVVAFDAESPEMELEGEFAPGMSGTMILVDNVMYIPADATGSQYVSLDLGAAGNPLGQSFKAAYDGESAQELFETAATGVVSQGEEEVDGSTVDTYEVTIDAVASLEALGLGDLAAAGGSDLPEEFTYVVGFDEDGNVVRYDQTIPSIGAQPGLTQSITYSNFGVEVDVEAPDPSTVTDGADLFGGGIPDSSGGSSGSNG